MITIQGEDANIEIDIIDITNDSKGELYYYNFVKCNFYYKNKDVFFTSKDIYLDILELKNLYFSLKELTKKHIESYQFKPDRQVISIHFLRDQSTSDFLLHLHFYREWESDTSFQTNLRLSEEQLKKFIQEIHYLMLYFENK